jgi:transcriptional regulator with XRE-family HTH domain
MVKRTLKPTPSDVLRQAIAQSGLSLYRISKDSGVVRSSLIRFLRKETSLRLVALDALAEYLGLELVKRERKGK